MITLAELDRKIGKILPEIRKIRHELHRIPEIAGKEYKTSALIREKLSDLGLDMKPPFLGTDVIALLNPEKSGNLTLRADIDALPIEENNENLPYRSAHPGMMHACGHDGHAAMLLGAAEILAGIRGSVPCSVRLLFQPGEEMAALAREVLKSGALQDPEPDFITGRVDGRGGIFSYHSSRQKRPRQSAEKGQQPVGVCGGDHRRMRENRSGGLCADVLPVRRGKLQQCHSGNGGTAWHHPFFCPG